MLTSRRILFSQKFLCRLTKILVALSLAASIEATAQSSYDPSKIEFIQYGKNEGLSSSQTTDVIQDSIGFIWIATENGLNRFDGNEFKAYYNDNSDESSLSSNSSKRLLIDSFDQLWVGTSGGGLNLYDQEKDSFSKFISTPKGPVPLPNAAIECLFEDSNKILWIGTGGGLKKLDLISRSITSIQIESCDGSTHIDKAVLSICEDKITGNLWLSMRDKGVHVFDPNAERVVDCYQHDSDQSRSLSDNLVNHIFQDSKNRMWISGLRGINLYQRETNDFDHIEHAQYDSNSLGHNHIRHVMEDTSGRIWISTNHGLSLREQDDAKFKNYIRDSTRSKSLSGDFILKTFEDTMGSIWIVTRSGGINYLPRHSDPFTLHTHDPNDSNSISNNRIRSIFSDTKNQVWIGTRNGLNRYDGKQFTRYFADGDKTSAEDENFINNIAGGAGDRIWMVNLNGLSRLDGDTLTHFPAPPTYSSANIRASWICPDGTGGIWIVRPRFGISHFNGKRFIDYKKNTDDLPGLRNQWVSQMYMGSSPNEFWMASNSAGIDRFDTAQMKMERFNLSSSLVKIDRGHLARSIWVDSPHFIWVGGEDGILRFNLATLKFDRKYGFEQGLIDKAILDIAPDDQGFIWLATAYGLSRFDPKKERFVNFENRHGINTERRGMISYSNIGDGRVFMGAPDGLLEFDPKQANHSPEQADVILTNLRLFGRSVSPTSEDSPLQTSIVSAKKIRLSPGQSVLTLEFSALDFISPKKYAYQYRLEGFDQEWIHANSNRRHATYTNLDPGNYQFRLKASKLSGNWSERSLAIIVVPYWWQTFWFRCTLGLILIGLILGIYFLQRHADRRRERTLEHEVSQRTNQLRLLNQQLESEKRISDAARSGAELASKAKTEFLANMSHELRTPLNAVLGFAQLIKRRSVSKSPIQGIDSIIESGKHLKALIDDLLDISKIESNQLTLNSQNISLAPFLNSIVDMIREKAQRKRIKLNTKFHPDLPQNISADPVRLRQILLNLLSNAVKFTKEGQVEFSVDLVATIQNSSHPENSKLRFSVTDTGIGIPAEKLDSIFLPFESEALNSNEYEGTGLGLPICQKLVETMGGTLQVESQQDAGSCFSFEVDFLIDAPAIQQTPTHETANLRRIENRVALIVDDVASNRNMLSQTLEEYGFNVLQYSNGYEALNILTENEASVDIIFIDLHMPGIDGIELAKRIRTLEHRSRIPLISVSANLSEETLSLITEAGFDSALEKPLDFRRLEHTVSRYFSAEANLIKTNTPLSFDGLDHLPKQDDLEELKQQIILGDFQALEAWADRVKKQSPSLNPLIDQLRTFIQNFDITRLQEFIHNLESRNH